MSIIFWGLMSGSFWYIHPDPAFPPFNDQKSEKTLAIPTTSTPSFTASPYMSGYLTPLGHKMDLSLVRFVVNTASLTDFEKMDT